MKEEVLHEELLARKSSSLESYWVVGGLLFLFLFSAARVSLAPSFL